MCLLRLKITDFPTKHIHVIKEEAFSNSESANIIRSDDDVFFLVVVFFAVLL